jgi:hypothetical protein
MTRDTRYVTARGIDTAPCTWCKSTRSVRTYNRDAAVECVNAAACIKRQYSEDR